MTRRSIAVSSMVTGVAAASVGAGLAWGIGVGLLALGVLLVGLGALLGWDSD